MIMMETEVKTKKVHDYLQVIENEGKHNKRKTSSRLQYKRKRNKTEIE